MTELSLEGVFSGPLQGATWSFPPGLTVVLSTPADGGAELPLLFGGLVVPRRGSVRVGGVDPAGAPAVRARLGLVLAEEPPLLARSIVDGARQVLALRGAKADPMAVLSQHGLASVAGVAPEKAGAALRRHVAWALGLAIAEPLGLVVHEPLSLGHLASRERVKAELLQKAEAGVPVIAVTASPREASELGGSLLLLDRGRFVRRPGAAVVTELTPGAVATLRVRTPEARALARALLEDPAVTSLDWDESADAGELQVRGPDAEALSLAVLARARQVSAPLSSLESVLPALDEVRAATAGIWRAAYESAFRAASAPREAPAAPAAPAEPGPEGGAAT